MEKQNAHGPRAYLTYFPESRYNLVAIMHTRAHLPRPSSPRTVSKPPLSAFSWNSSQPTRPQDPLLPQVTPQRIYDRRRPSRHHLNSHHA
jgi:hypothetical protein